MSTPLDLTLTLDGLSEPLLFNSPHVAASFIERERSKWESLMSGPLHNARVSQPVRSALDASFKLWREHAGQVALAVADNDPAQAAARMRSVLASVESHVRDRRMVVTASPLGRTIFGLAESNPTAAAYLFSLNAGDELARALSPGDTQAVVGLLRTLPVVIQALAGDSGALHAAKQAAVTAAEAETSRDRVTEILAELTVLRTASEDQWAAFQTEATAQRDQALQDMSEKASQQLAAMDEQLATQRSSLFAAIKLRAPRTYWEDKAKKHRKAWLSWAAGFGLALAAGATAPMWATPYIATTLHKAMAFDRSPPPTSTPPVTASVSATPVADEGRWVVPLVSLGVPLFVALWLARLTSRQVSEHLLREEDARERSVMVETFLALNSSESGEALEGLSNNFPVILQAIFRPGPGLGTDDSPPVGLIDAVLKVARPGGPK